MSPTRRLTARAAIAALSLTFAFHAAAQDTDTPADAPAPAETATVERGGFTAEVRGLGRYTAVPLGEVRFEPEAYSGEMVVAEVLKDHGRVSPGEVVLRLDATDMEEQLEDAREALARAEQRLGWARAEAEMSQAELAFAVENRALDMADALEDFEQWSAFGKDDAFTQARLNMESYEARVADEEEELRQLEQLYEGARLASRTQDIVLERARRRLAVSHEMLEIARRSHEVTMETTLPRRVRDMDNRMRRLEMKHAHAERRDAIARERKAIEMESAEEGVELAREHLANLEADAASLELAAETGGVLFGVSVTEGDTVSGRQVLGQLQHHGRGTLSMSIKAEDLRTVREGDTVSLRWRPFPEVQTTATVREIAWVGQGSGESTTYAVTLDVNEVADVVRPGMVADITATREFDNARSVPAEAVARDADGTYCMVRDGDTFTRRGVIVGATNADRVQIIDGLEEGETVRVPAN